MDAQLLQTLNQLVDVPGIHHLCWLVDQAWAPLLVLVLVVADIARRKTWLEIPAVIAAVVAADVVCARVLKPSFERLRPCVELDWVVAPFGCGAAFSMPSCHAANLFALAMVINRPWAFALAVVGTLARSVAGVHYPSDLLAGAVVGLALGWVARFVLNSILASRRRKARASRKPSASGRLPLH